MGEFLSSLNHCSVPEPGFYGVQSDWTMCQSKQNLDRRLRDSYFEVIWKFFLGLPIFLAFWSEDTELSFLLVLRKSAKLENLSITSHYCREMAYPT